jgi:hypothetical protein
MFLTAFFCNFVGRPMLSTVINMITSGQPKRRLEDISHAVVVEKEGAPLRRVPNLVRRIAILRRSPNFFCWCARTAPVFAFAPATERFRPPDAKTSQYGSVQEVLSKFAPHATITRLFARCACCWRSAVRDQSQSNWAYLFCGRPETEEEQRRRHLQYTGPWPTTFCGHFALQVVRYAM